MSERLIKKVAHLMEALAQADVGLMEGEKWETVKERFSELYSEVHRYEKSTVEAMLNFHARTVAGAIHNVQQNFDPSLDGAFKRTQYLTEGMHALLACVGQLSRTPLSKDVNDTIKSLGSRIPARRPEAVQRDKMIEAICHWVADNLEKSGLEESGFRVMHATGDHCSVAIRLYHDETGNTQELLLSLEEDEC